MEHNNLFGCYESWDDVPDSSLIFKLNESTMHYYPLIHRIITEQLNAEKMSKPYPQRPYDPYTRIPFKHNELIYIHEVGIKNKNNPNVTISNVFDIYVNGLMQTRITELSTYINIIDWFELNELRYVYKNNNESKWVNKIDDIDSDEYEDMAISDEYISDNDSILLAVGIFMLLDS